MFVSVAPEFVRIVGSTGSEHSNDNYGDLDAADESTGVLTGRAGEDLHLECVSAGGNPAPKLSWMVGDQPMPSKQAQENSRTADGSWRVVSRLMLPVSRADHRAKVVCVAEHDALDQNLVASRSLDILFPPRAVARVDKTGVIAEGETVVLSCSAEANPPASIAWRRPGQTVLTTQPSFTIQSVGKEAAGRYECVAENMLGLSQPAPVDVEVECKYLYLYYMYINMCIHLFSFALINQGEFSLSNLTVFKVNAEIWR